MQPSVAVSEMLHLFHVHHHTLNCQAPTCNYLSIWSTIPYPNDVVISGTARGLVCVCVCLCVCVVVPTVPPGAFVSTLVICWFLFPSLNVCVCVKPRAPVAECGLSVCCCVLGVLVCDPSLCHSLRDKI